MVTTDWPRNGRTDKGQASTDWTIPAWHDDALCARPGRDPRDYDAIAKDYRPGSPREDNVARAVSLCAGCPVLQQCALEALFEQCKGTTRAGVPLHSDRLTRQQYDALCLVASGETPASAVVGAGLLPADYVGQDGAPWPR